MTKDLTPLYDLVRAQSKIYDASESVHEDQTWDYHIIPVIRNAIMLGGKHNADIEVLEVAALFHDYANLVDFPKYSDTHHIASGELAEPILLKHGYSQEFIDKVKKCIFSHRGREVKEKLSIEQICLADADAITHIENVVEIIMWMGQCGKSIRDGNSFVKNKMKNSYAKLSDESKEYMKAKFDAIMTICY